LTASAAVDILADCRIIAAMDQEILTRLKKRISTEGLDAIVAVSP